MMKISKKKLLICIILTAPFMPLSVLFVLDTINPMRLVFITSFRIENQSGQDIWVTPTGTYGAEGHKSKLPLYITAVPAFVSFRDGRLHVKNERTIKIKYDCDDINFSEIAIESKDGQLFQFVVDPNPTKNQYHPPKSKHFIIPALETLPPLAPNVREAIEKKSHLLQLHAVNIGSILLCILFWRMLVYYKKLSKSGKDNSLPNKIPKETEG